MVSSCALLGYSRADECGCCAQWNGGRRAGEVADAEIGFEKLTRRDSTASGLLSWHRSGVHFAVTTLLGYINLSSEINRSERRLVR